MTKDKSQTPLELFIQCFSRSRSPEYGYSKSLYSSRQRDRGIGLTKDDHDPTAETTAWQMALGVVMMSLRIEPRSSFRSASESLFFQCHRHQTSGTPVYRRQVEIDIPPNTLGMVVHLAGAASRSVLFQRMISMAVLCPLLPRDPFRDLRIGRTGCDQLLELLRGDACEREELQPRSRADSYILR